MAFILVILSELTMEIYYDIIMGLGFQIFQVSLLAKLITFWSSFMLFINDLYSLWRWTAKILFAMHILSFVLISQRSQLLDTANMLLLFNTSRTSSILTCSLPLVTHSMKVIDVLTS